jgi:hypothetical protein
MKILYCAVVLFLFGRIAIAQQFFTVLPDTHFPIELHGTIRAAHAKIGDLVEFRTIEPVLIGNGVVVPANAKVQGIVLFVRTDPKAIPVSWVRIRIQELRWKTGLASLNAVVDGVHYAPSAYFDSFHRAPRATFLEGIHVAPHPFRKASTDFFSDTTAVVLHDGIILEMRHVVMQDNADGQSLSANSLAGTR